MSNPVITGALLIVASELMFTSMGATIKALAAGSPNEVVVFFRNLFGLLFVLPLLLRRGVPQWRTAVPHLHLLRSLAGVSAMYCFFYALGHLALADAVLLKLTAPIFIPWIAALWLGEHNSPQAIWAVVVGFAGVFLLLAPGDSEVQWAMAVGLAGGLLAALAKVTVRRLRGEPPVRVVFYFAVIATGVSAVPLLWAWQMPSPREWLLLLLLGAFATAGQLLLTRAYALAPAARMGPFTYVSVLFAAGYGWLLWGETMQPAGVLGGALIVASGLLALWAGEKKVRARRSGATFTG